MRAVNNTIKNVIFAIILALPVLFSAAAFAEPKEPTGKPENKKALRVLYWNIQNGMWAGQPDHYQKFVDWINSWHPDICIFDEGATNVALTLPHLAEPCSSPGRRFIRDE